MNTEITVDLEKVENFVRSDEFCQFLIANAYDFETAAYILQILLEDLDKKRGNN